MLFLSQCLKVNKFIRRDPSQSTRTIDKQNIDSLLGGPFFPPMQTYPSPTFSPPRGSTRQNLWPKWKYASQYHLPVVLNHITFQAVKCFQSSCLDKNFFRFKRRKEEYQKIVNIGSVVFNEYVVLVLWCWNKSNAAVFVTVTKVVTNCQIE